MEKHLNHYDKECMKMAMLKHQEAFREQVYELHRLYRIQKILMKDIVKATGNNQCYRSGRNQPGAQIRLDLERPAEEFKPRAESGGKCRVSETENDHDDLELTLGSRSYYYQRKTKAAEPGCPSDAGPSFSSSSTGSSNTNRKRSLTREESLNQQKWGLEMSVSSQDRLNNPPWLFQALSLNMT